MPAHLWIGLLLTVLAAVGTLVGGLIGLAMHRPSTKWIAFVLAFAAGAMLLLSLAQLLPEGAVDLGWGWATALLAAGVAGFWLLDRLIPHRYLGEKRGYPLADTSASEGMWPLAPQDELRGPGTGQDHPRRHRYRHRGHHRSTMPRIHRAGVLLAIGMILHNIPEGAVTVLGTVHEIRLGIVIAVGMFLHNLPEGIPVALLIYTSTRSRSEALRWTWLNALSEPAGGLLAAATMGSFLTEGLVAGTLAVVAGIMVGMSVQELVPAARLMRRPVATAGGLAMGAVAMGASVWLLA
jgi:ZIP family zinc transporter